MSLDNKENEDVTVIDFSQEGNQKKKSTLRKRMSTASAKVKAKSGKAAADFKKFAFKGNIIDLAIAVIIGTAFGKITASLVGDIIMPGIGALVGDVDFSTLKIIFKKAVYDADGTVISAENALRYGAFIQTILEFFIIALSIFIIYKVIMNIKARSERKKAKQPVPVPPLSKTEQLLTDIKDLLKKEKGK